MNTTPLRRLAVLLGSGALAGSLLLTVAAGSAFAGISSPACAFADNETATECQITLPWTVGGGGVGANQITLPGPYAFHKTLHVTSTGSIRALGPTGLVLNIDGTSEGAGGQGGALVMDNAAALIDTSEDGSPANDGAGPLTISATGPAQLASGSVIKAENTNQGGNGGDITLTFGQTSTIAGEISSQSTAGTTSNEGGDIRLSVTGSLTLAPSALLTTEKNSDSGKSGDIRITVSGDMTMQGGTPGAIITANHPGASNGTPGGNIRIDVGTGDQGTFTMESGTLVDSGGAGFAGNIWIKAGEKIDVQTGAQVLAGQRNEQDTRGHGGRIWVVAGCQVNIFGTLSSQGQDPGADLVHVEGCQVHVGPKGLIESTGSGHQPTTATSCDGIDDPSGTPGGDPADDFNQPGEVFRPDHPDTSSFCVEIWARHVIVDAGGEVNADGGLSGGTDGSNWIDIFAESDVILNGPTTGSVYAVHANTGFLTNDTGGDVRILAQNAFVTTSGLAVQANATGAGGDGGTITVGAGTNVSLGTASLQAQGAQSGGGAPTGGTISVRAYTGNLTGAKPGELNTDGATVGTVTLQRCLGVVADYSGNIVGTLNTPANACVPTTPSFPAYVVFNPGNRWDRCGQSSISGHKYLDGTTTGLQGWTIHITGPGVDTTTVTLADGSYSFNVPGGQTYLICEVLQASWAQTLPVAGPGVVACSGAGEAPLGYSVVLNVDGSCCGGQQVTGKDFANRRVSQGPPECKEDPNRTALQTRTVDTSKPAGGGSGNAGDPVNYLTLQAAYTAAKASPNTKDEVIGMYSKTSENVILSTYYAKSVTITQCTSAQLTDASGNTKPVWDITSTKKLLIIGPDSVGGTVGWLIEAGSHELKSIRSNGATVAGIRILSDSNQVSFNNVASSGIGIDVLGNKNTLKSGTIGPNGGAGVHVGAGKTTNTFSGMTIQNNQGNGVWIEGTSNTVDSNKILSNSPNGVQLTGGSNKVTSNQIDSNTQDGVNVTSTGNTLQDNKVSKNGGDGFDISAATNTLKGNASNNGSSGGSSENVGYEYRFTLVSVTNGGNKKDGVTFTIAVAGTYE